MNDKQRLEALKAAQRLSTWFSRLGRGDPRAFVRSNRAELDTVLAPFVPATLLAAKRPWRQWPDLPERERQRLTRWLTRKRKTGGATIQLELSRKRVLISNSTGLDELEDAVRKHAKDKYQQPAYGRHQFAGFNVRNHYNSLSLEGSQLNLGTPAERLDQARRSLLRAMFYGYKCPQPSFLAQLHPDDVEVSYITEPQGFVATIDRAFRKLHQLLSCPVIYPNKSPSGLEIPGCYEWPLAAVLSLTDPLTKSEVYYCAVMERHRNAPPTLARSYLGRYWDMSLKQWRIVPTRYKRASGALQAANHGYAQGASRTLHREVAA